MIINIVNNLIWLTKIPALSHMQLGGFEELDTSSNLTETIEICKQQFNQKDTIVLNAEVIARCRGSSVMDLV